MKWHINFVKISSTSNFFLNGGSEVSKSVLCTVQMYNLECIMNIIRIMITYFVLNCDLSWFTTSMYFSIYFFLLYYLIFKSSQRSNGLLSFYLFIVTRHFRKYQDHFHLIVFHVLLDYPSFHRFSFVDSKSPKQTPIAYLL